MALLEEGSVSTDTILTQLLRMQQVCSGHVKTDDGVLKTFDSAKLPELMSILEETDGKVIIWATFTHDILEIQKAITEKYGEESVATYYGATESDERQEIVNRFEDPSKVTYVDIIAENTTDERVLKALRNKINIASQVLAEDFRDWIV